MVRNATIGRWGSSVAPLCKKVHMMFGAAGLATLISACALAPEEGPVVFFGTLPCADCPGVDWRLRLFADGRGELERRYRDRDGSHHAQGRWSCGSRGESLRLTLEDGSTIHLALLLRSVSSTRAASPLFLRCPTSCIAGRRRVPTSVKKSRYHSV